MIGLFTGLSMLPVNARADMTVAAASQMGAAPAAPGFAQGVTSLPRVLSSSDVSLYKQMFDLGERGQWSRVDSLIPRLSDRLLLGHVMAQRYLHPKAYRSSYPELKAWMDRYADHPDAEDIHALGLRRKPKRSEPLTRPNLPQKSYSASGQLRPSPPAVPAKQLSRKARKQAASLKRKIRRAVWKGQTATAKQLIQSTKAQRLLGAVELDEMGARLGQQYFIDRQDAWAIEWAGGAARRSGLYLPSAHWTAGLAAWRSRRLDEAAYHFETLAGRHDVSPWMVSAGAFWAARTHLVANEPEKVNPWLKVAASYPTTFYGILARHILGLPMPFQWDSAHTEQSALDDLARSPGGRRALALIQAGQMNRAEQELRTLAGRGAPGIDRGIVVAASRAGMPNIALRLHKRLFPYGGGIDAAAYPVPPWSPHGGFAVDRALVFAVIRQESQFNPRARSSAGARGLMQLMPGTARYVARGTRYDVRRRNTLYQPGVNLSLGQRYMQMLLGDGLVNGDLFRLATAWNGGPGNLQDWGQRVDYMGDPLFFIESIPARETRNFIEKVLANLWIYRDRFDQPAPSLDALAAGNWPAYRALDSNRVRVATYGEN